jgi:kynurenine formamidase
MVLPAEFTELAAKVNNWGRWGADDEIGTLNLIDAAAVRAAASLVRTGKRFPLAIPLSTEGPQLGYIKGRINPLRTMAAINTPLTGDPEQFCSSDDVVVMGMQAGTHWDSLAHVSYAGRMYNGFPLESTTVDGASRAGIDKVGTLVGRGVLLDLARAHGSDRLPGGHPVTADDLDAAVDLARVQIRPGDIVLLRTGQIQHFKAGDRVAYFAPNPGPSMQSVPWFHEHDIAAVATDSATFEVFPCERDDVLLPVHLLHLVEMGLTQGQNFDLEALAADCADDGVYEFFLDATPLQFTGGLGSPVNPVAIK